MECLHPQAKPFSKCLACGEIFLPKKDTSISIFEIFEMAPTFFVDLAKVQKRFYELSRILHPDRFATKGAARLALATYWTAVLNTAFETLRSPENLAQYLFDLARFNLPKGAGSLPPALAEDYFNIQEMLEESPDEAKEQVSHFSSRIKREIKALDDLRDEAFRQWEKAHGPLDSNSAVFFKKAGEAIRQKSYLTSMAEDLEKKWPA
jgi:molecular chaperone HscB